MRRDLSASTLFLRASLESSIRTYISDTANCRLVGTSAGLVSLQKTTEIPGNLPSIHGCTHKGADNKHDNDFHPTLRPWRQLNRNSLRCCDSDAIVPVTDEHNHWHQRLTVLPMVFFVLSHTLATSLCTHHLRLPAALDSIAAVRVPDGAVECFGLCATRSLLSPCGSVAWCPPPIASFDTLVFSKTTSFYTGNRKILACRPLPTPDSENRPLAHSKDRQH